MEKIKQSFKGLSEGLRATSKGSNKVLDKTAMLTGKVSDIGSESINRLNRLTRTWRFMLIALVLIIFFNIWESQGKFIHDVIKNATFGVVNLMETIPQDNFKDIFDTDGNFLHTEKTITYTRHWFTHGNLFDWNFESFSKQFGDDWYTNVTFLGTIGLYTTLIFGVLALKGSHPTKRLVDTFLTDYFVTEIKEGRRPNRIQSEITVKEKIKETRFWKGITLRPDGKKKGMKGMFFNDGYLVNEIDIQYENVFAVTMAKHYGAKISEENKEVVENAKIKD